MGELNGALDYSIHNCMFVDSGKGSRLGKGYGSGMVALPARLRPVIQAMIDRLPEVGAGNSARRLLVRIELLWAAELLGHYGRGGVK
jgi:hypothetical protein